MRKPIGIIVVSALLTIAVTLTIAGSMVEAQTQWLQLRWKTQVPAPSTEFGVKYVCVFDRYVVITSSYKDAQKIEHGYIMIFDKGSGSLVRTADFVNGSMGGCVQVGDYLYVSFSNYTDKSWRTLIFDRSLNMVGEIGVGGWRILYDGAYLYFADRSTVVKTSVDGGVVGIGDSRAGDSVFTFTPAGDIVAIGGCDIFNPNCRASIIDRNTVAVKSHVDQIGGLKLIWVYSGCVDPWGNIYVSVWDANILSRYVVKMDRSLNVVKILNLSNVEFGSLECVGGYVYAFGGSGNFTVFDTDLNVVYTGTLDGYYSNTVYDGSSIYGARIVLKEWDVVGVVVARFDTPFTVYTLTLPFTFTATTTVTQTETATTTVEKVYVSPSPTTITVTSPVVVTSPSPVTVTQYVPVPVTQIDYRLVTVTAEKQVLVTVLNPTTVTVEREVVITVPSVVRETATIEKPVTVVSPSVITVTQPLVQTQTVERERTVTATAPALAVDLQSAVIAAALTVLGFALGILLRKR